MLFADPSTHCRENKTVQLIFFQPTIVVVLFRFFQNVTKDDENLKKQKFD